MGTWSLLTDEDASFEGGTVGNWSSYYDSAGAVSSAEAYHGSKSLKIGRGGLVEGYAHKCTVTAVTSASTQYTASLKFKGVVGKSYIVGFWDTNGLLQIGTAVVADGTWQTAKATKTFSDGAVRCITIGTTDTGTAGFYIDAIQLEAGASATEWPLNLRIGDRRKSHAILGA